ncbi:MAG: alkane 1-monooxygenase [Sphingomonadales bacterium]|nr:alkane 1-monooxygenase [Sphingomonadales bacterium]
MRYPFAYLICLLLAGIAVGGFYLGGIGHYALPIVSFLIFPFFDYWRGQSHWPSEKRVAAMQPRTERGYDLTLFAGGATAVGLLFWALWAVSVTRLAWWEFAGAALTIGLTSGMTGIVVAHELVHRNRRWATRAAFLLMALVCYAQYCIEHVYGHHVRVGTAEDPVTARKGQSLYGFALQSAAGSWAFAWPHEAERLRRRGKSVCSIANRILVWIGFSLAVAAGSLLLLGPLSLLLFLLQSAIAILVFAGVDYIEHYGLTRERLPDGRLERIGDQHSWNSSYLLTNIGLYNAGRHADHHLSPTKPYHRLLHRPEAPQLPFGYAAMIGLALVPPLWFRIMDRELAKLRPPLAAASRAAPR